MNVIKQIQRSVVLLSIVSIVLLRAIEVQQNSVGLIVSNNKKQNLVVIRGTANCGKSTLCKALSDLDSSYIIISQDDIHRRITYEICESVFPAEMAIIRNSIKYEDMWRAIRCFDVLCVEGTSEEEKLKVIGAIQCIRNYFDDIAQEKQRIAMRTRLKHSVMEQLLFEASCGRNIIFDSWGITNWDNELEQLTICFDHTINVVVYCSLETVIKRWNKRNKDAIEIKNLNDRRMFCQSFTSFFSFFKPAEKDQTSSLIVTKQEFDLLIQDAAQYISDFNVEKNQQGLFSHYEFTQQDLLEFKEKIYTKFGFDKANQVALVPAVGYDILICTEGDCNNYARELLNKLKNKCF